MRYEDPYATRPEKNMVHLYRSTRQEIHMRNAVTWRKTFQTFYRRRIVPSRGSFTMEDMRTPRPRSPLLTRSTVHPPNQTTRFGWSEGATDFRETMQILLLCSFHGLLASMSPKNRVPLSVDVWPEDVPLISKHYTQHNGTRMCQVLVPWRDRFVSTVM